MPARSTAPARLQPNQGAFQQAGKVQVILGQRHRPAEGHQVLHRDVVTQGQAAGTPACLRARMISSGRCHVPAGSGYPRPVPFARCSPISPVPASAGCARRWPGRSAARGSSFGRGLSRQRPRLASGPRPCHGPQLDPAARSAHWVAVRGASPAPGRAELAPRQRECGVDGGQNSGADQNERSSSSARIGACAASARLAQRPSEVGKVGTLETIVRLLLSRRPRTVRGWCAPSPAKNSCVA